LVAPAEVVVLRRGVVALVLLGAGCGGRAVEALPEPCFVDPGPISEGPCPPSHDLVGDQCVVREIYFPGGIFVMGRGYCAEAGLQQIPPAFDCPLADAPHAVTIKPFFVEATVRLWRDGPAVPADAGPNDFMPGSAGPAPQSLEMECQKSGKRLLTEAEWEYIATGGGTRTYPWGECEPSCELGNIDIDRCPPRNPGTGTMLPAFSRVASYPPTAEGVYDLAGNAPESVAPSPEAYTDDYTAVPFQLPAKCLDDPGAGICNGGTWVPNEYITPVRGGGHNGILGHLRSAWRGAVALGGPGTPEDPLFADGGTFSFRCARSAE
jgi:hypothetical protein